jgi:hypothetical protein
MSGDFLVNYCRRGAGMDLMFIGGLMAAPPSTSHLAGFRERLSSFLLILEQSTKWRILVLIGGLLSLQIILFAPSLSGSKILLPVDILASPGIYLPQTPEYKEITPHNLIFSDLVLTEDEARRFSAGEFRAGRLPLWNPLSYTGAPFASFGKYNPFEFMYIALPSPFTLAWMQLVKSLVAGLGAYCFFRHGIGVRAFPAIIGAWCYPLTGFFMYWQGYAMTFVMAWFPWILLAIGKIVSRPQGWGGPVLALLTAFSLLGGHLDIAGQLLLAAGIFALWALFVHYTRSLGIWKIVRAALVLSVAWSLGFLLAAPYWLPLMEYSRTGARMQHRQVGREERPPAGLSILPQTVIPHFYGSTQSNSTYLGKTGDILESAAPAYTGLLATLLLAPLAWCHPRYSRQVWFWLGLGLFALGWQLNLPGVVQLLRLPGLNMFSHNRFVFATSFAILALAIIGLDTLFEANPEPRFWFVIPVALLILLAVACAWSSTESPDLLGKRVQKAFNLPGWVVSRMPLQKWHTTFVITYLQGLFGCLAALGAWAWIWTRRSLVPTFVALAGLAMVGELLAFAWDLNPQCDPSLYYPRLPVLEQVSQAPPGRVLSIGGFQANIHEIYGFHEIRGYDGIDPNNLVELLEIIRSKDYTPPPYAVLKSFFPQLKVTPEGGLETPKILDMLNVRYLLFRGEPDPAAKPLFQGDNFWVIENPNALPRAYIPRRVQTVPSYSSTLSLLGEPDFDPRQTAYVLESVDLPDHCEGTARITKELPCEVEVTVDMNTPGLLVLADLYDKGWHAQVNQEPATILRTNHALRGVVVPAGCSLVRFRYQPTSLLWGWRFLAAGSLLLLVWAAWVRRCQKSEPMNSRPSS